MDLGRMSPVLFWTGVQIQPPAFPSLCIPLNSLLTHIQPQQPSQSLSLPMPPPLNQASLSPSLRLYQRWPSLSIALSLPPSFHTTLFNKLNSHGKEVQILAKQNCFSSLISDVFRPPFPSSLCHSLSTGLDLLTPGLLLSCCNMSIHINVVISISFPLHLNLFSSIPFTSSRSHLPGLAPIHLH